MFKKLLKYDMLAVWRFWWLIAVGEIGLSVVGSLVLRFLLIYGENPNFSFFTVLGTLFLFVCGVALFSAPLATSIFVYLRFYKNFYTDEGYLTFTLPVTRRQLFLSKMLNALIWDALQIVLFLLLACIVMLIAPPAEKGALINTVAYQVVGKIIAQVWGNLGGWLIVYALEALLLYLFSALASIGLIYFCITVGSIIAKKAKLLAAIGIYYAMTMAFSLAVQIFGTVSMLVLIDGILWRVQSFSKNMNCFLAAVIAMVLIAMMAVLASLAYCVTLNRIERKLNLA